MRIINVCVISVCAAYRVCPFNSTVLSSYNIYIRCINIIIYYIIYVYTVFTLYVNNAVAICGYR